MRLGFAGQSQCVLSATNVARSAPVAKTLRAKCLEALQLLRRLEESDDNGYARCVTCGVTKHYKEMDGGHFIPKGDSSFWALEEENVHPQCKSCNGFGMKHGTAAYQYLRFMEDKYGEVFVTNMIETKRHTRKIYTADYRDMLASMKDRIKAQKQRVGEH